MLDTVFVALFLPCAGMSVVFIVYMCLLCHSVSFTTHGQEIPADGDKPPPEKGLSASDLEKLPKVTGNNLVLGADCAVCLEEIEGDQAARIIPGCNHGFHLECADSWLSKNSNCPMCRCQIGPELLNQPEPDLC